MIRHYYTLERLTEEFQCLWGCEITECFSQEKDVMNIVFNSGTEIFTIQFSADPKLCSIFLRTDFHRAKRNSADIFECMIGETVQEINLLPGERIMHFKLIYTDLYFMVFGGSKSDCVAVNHENKIIDSLQAKNSIGSEFIISYLKPSELNEFPSDTPLLKAVSGSSAMLGKYYAEELLNSMNIEPNTILGNLNEEQKSNIENKMLKLRRECQNSKQALILQDSKLDKVLSLIPLSSYPIIVEKFDDISNAVQRRVINYLVDEDIKKK